VWFVSNCYSGSNAKRRLKLADDMIKNGLKLDRYGKCFKDTHFTGDKLDFQRFVQTYKFYLAFENSLHCRDYITEKFFVNGLTVGTVPVVYGALRKDYEAIAPPHSFIHVEDFNTTKELVDYLNYLDKNQTAYAEYFAWRDKNPHAAYQCWDYTGFCALCRSLYGISANDKRPFWEIYGEKGERYNVSTAAVIHPQSIRSIHEWWHVNESKDCMNDVWATFEDEHGWWLFKTKLGTQILKCSWLEGKLRYTQKILKKPSFIIDTCDMEPIAANCSHIFKIILKKCNKLANKWNKFENNDLILACYKICYIALNILKLGHNLMKGWVWFMY